MRGASTFAMAAAAVLACGAQRAHAWGHTGHVLIGQTAMRALPDTVPAFLRTGYAVNYVGELAAEADVSKSSGDAATPNADVHDFERDSGHYIDLDDNGFVQPTPSYPEVAALQLSQLLAPAQGRRDFDTLLRVNTPTGTQQTQYTGYLPFNLVDHWQQIRKDLAYWRAFTAAIANPATAAADRDFFTRELRFREALTLRDIGYWAHFVGDASQPMHVSVHYNGWGSAYPNPNGYTTSGIHAAFEGAFVKANLTARDIAARIGAYADCATVTGAACAGIEPRVRWYLGQTLTAVVPLYDLTKTLLGGAATGNPWSTTTDPAAKAFVAARVAAGAQEMRDEIVDATASAGTIYVGYPLIKVADVESGAVVLTRDKFAGD